MEATPEEHAKASNVVKALQETMAKKKSLEEKAGSSVTRRERAEQTADPDARKTRQIIREGRFTSLPILAKELIPVIGDLAERHRLEEAFDAFVAANAEYRRTEELPPAVIDWLGPPNGVLRLPEGAPWHKNALALAWNHLLRVVNELSKVGIVKPAKLLFSHEPTAIELLADPDDPAVTARGEPMKWD
jgi:hypothetical protein